MDPSERFFRSLYEKQYEKMFKLAYRMTGSIEKTQDLVQNLRFEQRLSYAEIGDRLGISEGACRSRLHRALQRCKRFLNDT